MEMGDEDMTMRVEDDLLLHILSRLPTKDALRTCVLSTRWRYMWKSFSNIDLDDTIPNSLHRRPHYPHRMIAFLQLVDRLVRDHDNSNITRFRVSCDALVQDVRLNSWISAVINHNVKEIDLCFPLTRIYILPSCLFSSRSLTTLSINVQYGVLGFPSSLSSSCPSLKSLSLSHVNFVEDQATKDLFFQLSSIFPTLEKLSLIQCEWKNIEDLEIRSSTLENITVDIYGVSLLECEVMIFAPRLSCFYCKTDVTIGVQLEDPTVIADASLEFSYPADDEPEAVYERLTTLLIAMRNSNHLTLSAETLWATGSFSEDVPVLQNLTDLDITGFVSDSTVEDIMEFVHKTPNLEYLALKLETSEDDHDLDDWWSDDFVAVCPLHKLKILKVEGLDALEAVVDMIQICLENAPNLEKVEVIAPKRNEEGLEAVRKGIVELPRISEKCAFFFEVKTDD